jgi:peroxiredoxin
MATRTATVGTRAPAFRIPCTQGPGAPPGEVSLEDYADRWLVLVFYPRDFSLL